MRIAVVGAGALGSLYAGMLARAGTDVTLLGRSPAHIDMIRAEGLRMTVQAKADWTVRLAATVDAHTIGRVDTVIFLTKTPDVHQAAIGARPLFGPATLAVTLQHGLCAPEAVAAVHGPVAIAAGVPEIGRALTAPGAHEMHRNLSFVTDILRTGHP